jgi:apolipoprotein N-acyltransferase
MRTDGKLAVLFDAAIAAALGAIFSLSFVYTTQAWWLQFACIGLLAWGVSRVSVRRAALLGSAFGTAWMAASIWWLFISMHRYGGLPAPLAALAVAALAAGLSLFTSTAVALFARLRRGHALTDALLFGACWLAAELARGLVLTGFPWVATGYGQVDAPLAAAAPWVGVYGIGAIVATLAAWLAFNIGITRQLLAGATIAAFVFASPLLLQRDFTSSAGRIGVTLVQTNVPQNEKFVPQFLPETLEWLQTTLAAAPGPLVLAPETAIPLLPEQLGDDGWQRFAAPFREGTRAALVGLPLGDYDTGYTNSMAGISRDAPQPFYRYDKQHLVPFGEFIPDGFRWFTDLMNIPLGNFARGPLVPPSFAFAGQRIGPNICYEDLFGEELARRFGDAATAPTILANVSNMGWFGDTIALTQHLNISRLRSLELQRPMIRATNTGATAAIDHRGMVTAQMQPLVRGVLQAEVEGRNGLTPYARVVARFGLWPWMGWAAGVLAWAVLARRRDRPASA